MTATRQDIKGWLETAKEKGATHLVVVHDHWDHQNFPLYIMPGQDARATFNEEFIKSRHHSHETAYSADECYNMSMGIDDQLKEHRANHWSNNG